jgi:hypothetical protein
MAQEPHFTLSRSGGQHIDAIPSAKARHDRSLPDLAPGGTAAIIGPDPGLIGEHN